MHQYCRLVFRVALIFSGVLVVRGQTKDTIVFGNTASEASHALFTGFDPVTGVVSPASSDPSAGAASDTTNGVYGLTPRRLLPRTPNADIYGGYVIFTMAVDPIDQNYFTLKVFGTDSTSSGGGDFLVNCEGKEIGWRHGGTDEESPGIVGGTYTNCFVYRTVPLELHLTHGKTNITIKIHSSGSRNAYDALVYWPNFQKNMTSPTVPLYAAYTHINGVLDVSGEIQTAGETLISPRTLENETTVINNWKSSVNGRVNNILASTSPSANDLQYLAQAYSVSWTPAYNSAAAITREIAGMDTIVTAFATNTAAASSGWGGALGGMGDAIRLLYPQLSNSLDTVVNYGGTLGSITRLAGWSAALRASVDSGRFGRQTIGNQAQANCIQVYLANRGLLLIDPTNALYETEARRYIAESMGASPWMGNDQTGGGPVPVYGTMPYGPNWFMCTFKGTSREDGYVGGDYGEVGPTFYELASITGDTNLIARALTLIRARLPLRFPWNDFNGYKIMYAAEPIGCRNDGENHFCYMGRTFQSDFFVAAQGAAIIGNDVLGSFQQEMNDGQLLRMIASGNTGDSGAPYLPDRYNAFKAQAQTGVKIPTTSGQPDYAWGDEVNMIIAAKHGEERFYTALFWHNTDAINGLAKVFLATTNVMRFAEVKINDVRFNSSGFVTMRGYQVEHLGFPQDEPPDPHDNINDGVCYAAALRSDLTTPPPNNRDSGRGTGYTLRFGNWLVAINAHYMTNYTMQLPAGFTSATNLVDGTVLTAPVILAPKTTVVFYLPTNSDPNPPPARPLFLSANGFNTSVALKWNYSGGATNYDVKRATVSGGTYFTVGSTTNNFYTDTTTANNTTYYYVASSSNANGESGNSMETSATPQAASSAGLPPPWTDSDIGSVGSAGSASISGANYNVSGSGGDIYNTSDNFHFLYQPLFGDGVITAQVQSETGSSTKAGVMIRNSTGANAMNVFMLITPGNAQFQARTSTGGSTWNGTVSSVNAPYWVRLARAGATLTGYASPDGTNWTRVGSATIGPGGEGMGYVTEVGLAVTARNNSQLNTAVFNNVSLVAGDTLPPLPPAGVTATASPGAVAVIWSAAPFADAYIIRRATTNGGPYTAIGTNTWPRFIDSGLLDGVTYYYVVSATNRSGESVNSGQASATPTYIGTKYTGTVIGSPGGYSSSTTKDRAFDSNLSTYYDAKNGSGDWTGLDFGVGVNNLIGRIRYCPRNTYASRMVGGIFQGDNDGTFTNNPVTLYTITTAPPYNLMTEQTINITNKFRYVRYLGPNNANCNVAEIEFYSSLLPVPPPGLTAVVSNQQVALTWATNSGSDGYNLKRCVTSGGPYTILFSTITATNYTDTGLINGLTYYYVMSSTNSYGESDNSAEVSATPAGKLNGTIIGSAGTFGGGNTKDKALDSNLTTYYDAANGSGDWTGLDFGAGVSNLITQIKYCPRTGYPQRMAAGIFQGANDSSFTSPVTLFTVTVQPPTGVMTVQAISLTNKFRCVRYLGPANANCNVAELEFDGLAVNPPFTPTGLTATPGDAQVVLNWSAAANATGYKVKRSTTSGGSYTIVTTNSNVMFTNTGLVNGTMYYFVVSGLNSGGEGYNSAEAAALPVSLAALSLALSVKDNQFQLNWPADHLGWRLETQTNTSSTGLGTNWVTVFNSTLTNQFSTPISTTEGNVFFRLVNP